MTKRKRTTGQILIYKSTTDKAKYRAIRILRTPLVNLGDVEGSAVHVPPVTTAVLRLIQIMVCHE